MQIWYYLTKPQTCSAYGGREKAKSIFVSHIKPSCQHSPWGFQSSSSGEVQTRPTFAYDFNSLCWDLPCSAQVIPLLQFQTCQRCHQTQAPKILEPKLYPWKIIEMALKSGNAANKNIVFCVCFRVLGYLHALNPWYQTSFCNAEGKKFALRNKTITGASLHFKKRGLLSNIAMLQTPRFSIFIALLLSIKLAFTCTL